MNKNKKNLISKVKRSNLSKDDKEVLIDHLKNEKIKDHTEWLLIFYRIINLSKDTIDKFDIDIGSF